MFDIFKLLEKEKTLKSQKPIEYIVVGLGNPGLKYENTRHNVGFMAIDNISNHCNANLKKLKFKALIDDCTLFGKRVLLMKPQTFMNNSGESLKEAMSFYKIPPEKTIIIFDDISLDVGKLRIKRKGSHGGHNGIKSIINLTNSDKFPRVKIGVGNKPLNWDLANWVLSKFPDDDLDKVKDSLANSYQSLEFILNENIDTAMNKFN
ncbi:MAG: aminoacyl-tRNA hydrolase [Clostridia bacterium]|nr:aminoacyl-tRNA hydrolase [Clostridia bacterium]